MKFCTSTFRVSTDDYLEIARACDEYGWDTMMLSDHVLHPDQIESKYPYDPSGERPWQWSDDFPDVWVASGMMAAVTKQLNFLQMVYILQGWVVFEYEGQGEVTLRKGTSVLQPPGIRHREISHSDDLELIEICSPAEFETELVDAPDS